MAKLDAAGLFAADDGAALIAAAALQQALMQVLRIALDGPLDVAQAPAESEIRRLDRILDQRAVKTVAGRAEKCRVAFELGELERRAQASHHRVHQVGDDVLRMVELDAGEIAGVAGDVGDQEERAFGFR